MKRASLWAGVVASAAMGWCVPAFAQSGGYQVLPSGCGTGGYSSSAAVRPGTQNTSGQICTTGGGGGGGVTPSTPHSSVPSLVANYQVCSAACHLTAWSVVPDSTLSGASWWVFIVNATSDPGNGTPPTGALCYGPYTTSNPGASAILETYSTGVEMVVSTTGCGTITESTHAYLHGDAY